jgi:hypothetical protein
MIRQQLMCTADVGILGEWWVKGGSDSWVDFNNEHMCKNFDDIRQWAEEHQIEKGDMVQRRLGDTVLDEVP